MLMDFVQVKGNTWFLELSTGIPVYFLSSDRIILLDCGFYEPDGPMLRQFLSDHHLKVEAVLATHYHADHVGNCLWLQQEGAQIILPEWESVLGWSPNHKYLAYNPASTWDIAKLFPQMTVKADRTFPQDASSVSIEGHEFKVIPLPGHTYGHVGYVTPDNICYVGDTLMTESALERAKLPSTIDWITDFKSKQYFLTSSYDGYLLAHKGIVSSIRELAELNIADKEKRAAHILSLLSSSTSFTLNDAEQMLWKGLGLHTKSAYSQTVFRRNTRCAIEYLVVTGSLQTEFRDGSMFYTIQS